MKAPEQVLIGLGIAVCLIIPISGVLIVRRAVQAPLRAYATQGAAELVVWHLRLHTNQWPCSWEALAATHATLQREHSQLRTNEGVIWRTSDISIASTMEDIRRFIDIDWNADVIALREASVTNDTPSFRVVRLKDGKNTHWAGLEPNRMIWDYLQSTRTNPPAH